MAGVEPLERANKSMAAAHVRAARVACAVYCVFRQEGNEPLTQSHTFH